MRILQQIVLTILGCALLQFFLPWWTCAIPAFIFAFLFDNKSLKAFLIGFVSVAILWGAYAAIISFNTNHILTQRLNVLLPINSFLITSLIGGLVGGMAALTGALLRKL